MGWFCNRGIAKFLEVWRYFLGEGLFTTIHDYSRDMRSGEDGGECALTGFL